MLVDGLLAMEESAAHRDNMHIKVALSTLLFTPFREFRMSGWDETEASGRVGRVC
jgi:hypothetical protein